MSRTKNVSGECQHCSGRFQFPAESVGLTAACPHCGKQTEMLLATPAHGPLVPLKTILFTGVAVLILVAGLVAAMMAVNRLQRTAEQRKAVGTAPGHDSTISPKLAEPFAQQGFKVTAVKLERGTNNSAASVVGILRNETDRRRSGVRVEIELLDAAGRKIGTATDSRSVLEPKAEWTWSAPVRAPGAASARLVSIQTDP